MAKYSETTWQPDTHPGCVVVFRVDYDLPQELQVPEPVAIVGDWTENSKLTLQERYDAIASANAAVSVVKLAVADQLRQADEDATLAGVDTTKDPVGIAILGIYRKMKERLGVTHLDEVVVAYDDSRSLQVTVAKSDLSDIEKARVVDTALANVAVVQPMKRVP